MMNEWSANIVRQMSLHGITGLQLAKEAGFSNTYLSAVLHGKKGDDKTRAKVEAALDRMSGLQAERA